MGDSINISNPQDIQNKVRMEADFLKKYSEELLQEEKELASLENLISETEQIVSSRIRGLNMAMDGIRSQENSPAQQKALRDCQRQFAVFEEQARMVHQCSEELQSIRTNASSNAQDGVSLSDTAVVLSDKITKLIDLIIQSA